MPLAAHAEWVGSQLRLRAAWGDPEGAPGLITAQIQAAAPSLGEAERLGTQVADQLKGQGAH